MFDSCETRQCTNVTVKEDEVKESIESFSVSLERSPDLDTRITLDQHIGTIEITGNNGMLYIKLWIRLFKSY